MENFCKYKDLIDLLHKALGDRSWNQYALHAGIDSGHLSRIKNGNLENPPRPEILKKLAEKAHNGVTYFELMKAAKYLHPTDNESETPIIYADDIYDPIVQKAKKFQVSPEKLEKMIDILKNED